MTLRQLECFVEVGRTLNFTLASQNLFISQPAISYQISQLEKELGMALLVRSTHGVKLTAPGEILYRGANKALDLFRRSLDEAKRCEKRQQNEISVGHFLYVQDENYEGMVNAWTGAHGNTRVSTRFLNITDYTYRMAFNLDVAIFIERNAGEDPLPDIYDVARLCGKRLYGQMKSGHPLADRPKLKLGDVQPYPLLFSSPPHTKNLKCAALNTILHSPKYNIIEVNTPKMEEIRMHVFTEENSIMLSCGAHASLPRGLVQIPFGEDAAVNFMVGWKRDNPLVKKFVFFMRQYYEKHGPGVAGPSG